MKESQERELLEGGRLADPGRGLSESHRRTSDFVKRLSQTERRINGYILSLVPNWSDADEIAQETKLKLWEQFGDYDPSRDFAAWACTVAYYQVLTYRKQLSRDRARFSDEFVELVSRETERMGREMDGRHLAMEGCLKKLPE